MLLVFFLIALKCYYGNPAIIWAIKNCIKIYIKDGLDSFDVHFASISERFHYTNKQTIASFPLCRIETIGPVLLISRLIKAFYFWYLRIS